MSRLLYLVHRLPFPPNKGDKIRSFHLLQHLASRHEVFLGTFIDDPDDEQYLGQVRSLCADVHAVRIRPLLAKLRSATALLSREALTLPFYRNRGLAEWVARTIHDQLIDSAVVFSSAMAQYTIGQRSLRRLLVDFVDADSAKWTQYAESKPWPLSWIYRREGEHLLAFERRVARTSTRSFFVTDAERRLFTGLAPECANHLDVVPNGVDAAYFSPESASASPYRRDELPIVFTGAMDYWPNVDGACWFATEVLPALRARWPSVRFHIVGMRPAPAVLALASDVVVVSGTVPDIRPYLQHAAVIVAPLRIARGIQNKVLEAMSMGRPVVASAACALGIEAKAGQEIEIATGVDEFVDRIGDCLQHPVRAAERGIAARERILSTYSWSRNLAMFDRYLEPGDAIAPLVPAADGAQPTLASPTTASPGAMRFRRAGDSAPVPAP